MKTAGARAVGDYRVGQPYPYHACGERMLWSASCECGGAAGQRAARASMQLRAGSREPGARARTGERPAPALLHDKVEVLHVQAHSPLHIVLLQSAARCALTRAASAGVREARGCRPRTTASKSCDSKVAMRRRRSSVALLSYCVGARLAVMRRPCSHTL